MEDGQKINCIYFMQLNNSDGYIKIGFSSDVAKRQQSLLTGSPYDIKIIAILINETITTERLIHKILQDSKIQREWFYPTEEVMQCIKHVNNFTFQEFIDNYMDKCRKAITAL